MDPILTLMLKIIKSQSVLVLEHLVIDALWPRYVLYEVVTNLLLQHGLGVPRRLHPLDRRRYHLRHVFLTLLVAV